MKVYVPPISELEQIPVPRKRDGYCGIAAMSAAIGISPLKIHEAIPDWPGYTPSRTIISTLDKFGYDCARQVVPKVLQTIWPIKGTIEPRTALGRIYFGEGKYADSHWICFKWMSKRFRPFLYDNNFRNHKWNDTLDLNFYNNPARLKSLYYVARKK